MTDRDKGLSLTPLEAFDAMLLYLKMHAESMHSDDLESLFRWGRYDALTKDGFPMSVDAREYDEWLDCVESVLASKRNH